ncbi:MAG: fumarylacetoacetate hydrolase family protein, partial [Dongiaceae bacterium]
MKVNRIFCIGRNYAEHIKELGNMPNAAPAAPRGPDDAECVIFMKPASCVVPSGAVELPRGRGSVHHEAELVVMLSGGPSIRASDEALLGTGSAAPIPVASALEHVAAITLGLDLTLRDLQNELKKKGAPWELC